MDDELAKLKEVLSYGGSIDRRALAAIERLSARIASLESGQPVESGWLVENGRAGDALRYRTWRNGMPDWTADHNEATRYCRRVDAERAHAEDDGAQRIVEHQWLTASAQEAQEDKT